MRHKVNANDFFTGVVKAWDRGESDCGHIHITCREKKNDSSVFLFEKGSDVLAQIPISTDILRGNPDRPWPS